MRRIDTEMAQTLYRIRSYSPGRLVINDREYNESLIITPTQLITGWAVTSHNRLSPQSFEPILALKPDVLLVGTGVQHHFIPAALYQALSLQRIGVEVMSTHAACRTYNALMSEGRQVAAALIVDTADGP
jgi:uncharacterized protein